MSEDSKQKGRVVKAYFAGMLSGFAMLGLVYGGYSLSRLTSSQSTSNTISTNPTPPASATPEAVAQPSAASPTSPTPQAATSPVSFSDIQGVTGEKEITQLAQAGVFEGLSGNQFNPQQPISRAEFIRWLVRANNAIFAKDPGKQVRLAESGASEFPDVSPTHPDFRYIQGMINSGFAVGYDEKNFRPDQPITREEMIAIKSGFDSAGVTDTPDADERLNSWIPTWSDREQISRRFYRAINTGYSVFYGKNIKNVERTFGAIKSFKPKQPVTRAEAALCISVIGNHEQMALPKSIQEAL